MGRYSAEPTKLFQRNQWRTRVGVLTEGGPARCRQQGGRGGAAAVRRGRGIARRGRGAPEGRGGPSAQLPEPLSPGSRGRIVLSPPGILPAEQLFSSPLSPPLSVSGAGSVHSRAPSVWACPVTSWL